MKVLYFDTETTGIDPKYHEIVQFAAIAEIDGEIVEEINVRARPNFFERINPEALRVTGLTIEDYEKYPPAREALTQIIAFFDRHVNKYAKTDKFFPAGHNVGFDLDFLQNFFKANGQPYGIGSYQNWQALDSRVLANFLCFSGKISLENHKLETLCRHFGIELDAHDALNDIRATRTLIQKMLAI